VSANGLPPSTAPLGAGSLSLALTLSHMAKSQQSVSYLRDVFIRVQSHRRSPIDDLLPRRWSDLYGCTDSY
jgi:hypothetical protein